MLRLRVLVAGAASFALALCASEAHALGSLAGASVGVAGSIFFGMMALIAWRRSHSIGPPLLVDNDGVAVDDGLGESWHFRWDEIEAVTIEGGAWRRRVVLVLHGQETETISLPAICHGDAPPEWVAGLIETFREKAAGDSSGRSLSC